MPDRLKPGEVYAGDLGREHLGRQVSVDGVTGARVTGVLREVGHIDDSFSQLLVDGTILTVPAGRPVALDLP